MPIIYYVEDDQAISYVIEKTIENAKHTGVGFNNGEDFLNAFYQKKPDMILLDVMLPDISGNELLKRIRKVDHEIPVMMISALQSEMDKVIALDLGADDYLTKPFGILELTSRIQAKLRHYTHEKILEFGNVFLDEKKHTVTINHTDTYLTNKEFSILRLLLKNKRSVVSKETIFKEVWETDFIGETRTLDMHVKALRDKLNSYHANIKIKTIRSIGYQIE